MTLRPFPAAVSSVPDPVPPARPATMRFELVARLEFSLGGKMLGGMLMVSQSPLLGPSYSLFTDGTASVSPPFAAGWGLHILDPTGCVTHQDWGFFCLDPSSPEFVGASRDTIKSGELIALIFAFKWICALPFHSPLELNLQTDSDYAQKHLLFEFPVCQQGTYYGSASSFEPGSFVPSFVSGLD